MSKVRSRKHSYGKICCFGTIGNLGIFFFNRSIPTAQIQFCAATSNSQQSHTYPCQTTTITPGQQQQQQQQQQQAAPSISYPIYPRSPAPPKTSTKYIFIPTPFFFITLPLRTAPTEQHWRNGKVNILNTALFSATFRCSQGGATGPVMTAAGRVRGVSFTFCSRERWLWA